MLIKSIRRGLLQLQKSSRSVKSRVGNGENKKNSSVSGEIGRRRYPGGSKRSTLRKRKRKNSSRQRRLLSRRELWKNRLSNIDKNKARRTSSKELQRRQSGDKLQRKSKKSSEEGPISRDKRKIEGSKTIRLNKTNSEPSENSRKGMQNSEPRRKPGPWLRSRTFRSLIQQ